jgi:phytoene/squalene synthetase
MAVEHYENFPVASILLPPRLREPVAAIYGFARSADDFADEGEPSAGRAPCALLAGYQAELDAIEARRADPASGVPAPAPGHRRLCLPLQLFRDLLDAFMQDIGKDRYPTSPN